MAERYVISIKARKDVGGRDCEQWRYAGTDSGQCGTGYPCWCYSDEDRYCKRFSNIEDAKRWFDNTKSFLLGSHYNNDDLDMETLGIRKVTVTYKRVARL